MKTKTREKREVKREQDIATYMQRRGCSRDQAENMCRKTGGFTFWPPRAS